ncbi:mucin-3A-like isoform X3 [Ranitomeya variabilis]|uniref:mucin-3A-like isoform X3 n=1 Tax=Ranitomeya variabilis TaxID=490064 RepID=UPI004055D3E4
MMDLHLSLLFLLLSFCQVGGMLYFERNSGMIVCEDILDEIPECDATTKQTTECVTMISVIDCSTAQDTTSQCEELTEDPTDCDPPTIPTMTSIRPTNVSQSTDHTSAFSSVTDTDKTIDRDNTTISKTKFSDSPTTSDLTEPCDEGIYPCPRHFYGKNCRFIYNEIILDFVIAKLEMSIHVQNEEFNSSLNNPLSKEYQDFHDRFLNEMEFIYKSELPQFKKIRIVSFREGSIIVDHEVLLKVDYGKYLEETLQAEGQLRATLTQLNCSSNRTGRLCFNVNKTTIKRKYINDSDLCLEEESIPQDVRHYFYGLNMSRALLCVSECSVRHHSPIDCNWGQCLVVRDTGPHCYCDTSDQFWYTGDRCETPVSKPGVYGGVTVGLIVLVIIIVILVIVLCRRRYRSDEDLLVDNEPQCHLFEWTRDYKVHGSLVNPETDKMMFGPRGTFKLTMENVNPGAQLSLPRAQATAQTVPG